MYAAAGMIGIGDITTAHVFAAVSGALAVAALLAAAALARRLAAAQADARRLRARQGVDLTAEKVFLVREGRLTAASPATAAYVRRLEACVADEPEPGFAGDPNAMSDDTRSSGLAGGLFEPDAAARLRPMIERLRRSGVGFIAAGADVAGAEWRVVGETVGARAVLRLWPLAAGGKDRGGDPGATRGTGPEAALTVGEGAPTLSGDAARFAEARHAPKTADGLAADALLAVLEAAPTGALVFDGAGRLAAVNRAARRLLDLKADWIAARPSLRVLLGHLRETHKAPERPDPQKWLARVVSDPIGQLNQEGLWTLPDGAAIRLSARALPAADADAMGTPAPSSDLSGADHGEDTRASRGGFVLFVIDQTAELDLERQYRVTLGARRATLDALDHGVAVIRRDGAVQLMNPAFRRLWRLEAGPDGDAPTVGALDDLADAAARDPESRALWTQVARFAAAGKGPRQAERLQARLSDGRRLSVQLTPLPDRGALIACADVTDAHLAEAALKDKHAALEAVDRLKTEFLNDIAYHLRTPLNAVIGYGDMLKLGMAGPLAEKQLAYLDNVLSAADELREVISDALDLGALSAGPTALDADPLDLAQLVRSVTPTLKKRAERCGLALEIADLEAARALPMRGDATRLRHAIVSAAAGVFADAGRADRARIDVARGPLSPGGAGSAGGPSFQDARLTISLIRDNAPGADPTGAARWDGAGDDDAEASQEQAAELRAVGLALARRIVELHDGALRIDDSDAALSAVMRLPIEPLETPLETPFDAHFEEQERASKEPDADMSSAGTSAAKRRALAAAEEAALWADGGWDSAPFDRP